MIGRLGAASAAGLLIALAFPPTGLWPAAVSGVAVLTVAVAGLRVRWGVLAGLLAGLVCYAVLVRWLSVVGVDAWLALATFTALYFGLLGGLTTLVLRIRGWPWLVGAVWVLQEALRNRVPLGGWPWGDLAFSQAGAPWLPVANVGGAMILTFVVASAGGWLAWAWLSRSRRAASVAAVAAVLVAPWVLSLWPLSVAGESSSGIPDHAAVAVVQGDVPATGLGFANEGQRREVLDNHVRQTLVLAGDVAAGRAPQPDLVVWPENASDLDPYTARDAAASIGAAARAINAPIVVGAVVTNSADPDTVLNVSIVWDPATGPGDRYVKQHPVPFGEYVPFRGLLADRIDRFSLVPRDFIAGTTAGVLDVGAFPLGVVICFEIAYSDLVRDTVTSGARLLAVQTNNATYTGTGQSEQQLAMARIRAVEHGRAVVVAATNGISAMIQPDGSITASLPESSAGFLVAEMPLRHTLSVADRLLWWPELLLSLAAVTAAFVGLRRPPAVWAGGRAGIHPR